MHRERLLLLLIPIAALLAILPLLIHGCSCGHDFDFHLLSWMEATRQFTHDNLHPHWAFSAAWNAGEPRFVFYPPASWTIGAILGLILPWTWAPIAYTWIALTASGFALHRLARDFASPLAAILAAVFYTVNPYMLFTAYERTAYGELLAAAWIPLLLHAILRPKITIPRIAIPLALLWITNAPAAVMSCYALALLAILRLLVSHRLSQESDTPVSPHAGAPSSARLRRASRSSATTQIPGPRQSLLQQAANTLSGTILGLGLAAFYILPAAYERRFVQITMAVLPGLRIQDNFLFHRTADPAHDAVLHTASVVGVLLIAATIAALIPAYRRYRTLAGTLAVLTFAITLLLTPVTAIFWRNAPELAFLQFPWRLLALVAATLGLVFALCLSSLSLKPYLTAVIALGLAAAFIPPAYALFHQGCDPEDTVSSRLAAFRSGQGAEPTDEYTPVTADNDSLAPSNPPFWLSPNSSAKAPASTEPGPAPIRFTFTSPISQILVLNLRDYPAWRTTLNRTLITAREQRDDGLIALPVPAGSSTISITYAQTLDQTIGDIISLLSLIALVFLTAIPNAPNSRHRRSLRYRVRIFSR